MKLAGGVGDADACRGRITRGVMEIQAQDRLRPQVASLAGH
jgi:hypothetical protein